MSATDSNHNCQQCCQEIRDALKSLEKEIQYIKANVERIRLKDEIKNNKKSRDENTSNPPGL